MIKIYQNGKEFEIDNKEFLDLNKYMSSLFYINAKVLNELSLDNYAISVEKGNKKLLAIRILPYNLLFYGDYECLGEMIKYLEENNYFHNGIMCPTIIGEHLVTDFNYEELFSMDFMEAKEYTLKSSNEVLKATMDDLDEVYDCVIKFFKECGLPDTITKERLATKIDYFRIIKMNNKIVSMAAYTYDTEDSFKITHVYTRPEYRGNHYAKKIVNYIKNEILGMGKIATLNVDQKNPISNHIYASLGFKKVYSQAMYKLKK